MTASHTNSHNRYAAFARFFLFLKFLDQRRPLLWHRGFVFLLMILAHN